MNYPVIPDLEKLAEHIRLYAQLKHEYGSTDIEKIGNKAHRALSSILGELKQLSEDNELADTEPNDLARIKASRPKGPRRLWDTISETQYSEKLAGALLGRLAGCTLGAPVEFWSIPKMENLARELNQPFPPTDYWPYVPEPFELRYAVAARESYTREKMDGVPVDDDTTYTLLGLLILEEFGPAFTTKDVAQAWLKYLPYACTAEAVALENLKQGISPQLAGETENPFCEWIGADIRSDPWGYLAPGWPEKAAEMAYHDAFLSHRRQGIYGEMFFAAAIAAGFVAADPIEAIQIGLTEVPAECALTKAVKWALEKAPEIANYRDARHAVEGQFKGMHRTHTINNACLTIFGLTIGGTDFSRVIGETVAMGMDNDCTAATAGSIWGSVYGQKNIPSHWYQRFNDKIFTYLNDHSQFSINDVCQRFQQQAQRVFSETTPKENA